MTNTNPASTLAAFDQWWLESGFTKYRETSLAAWEAALRASTPSAAPMAVDVPPSCRDSHEASLKYVEGWEAAKADSAQVAERQPLAEWLLIDSAPRDGTGILALWLHPDDSVTARNYALVEFVRGCWRDTESDDQVYTEPTHWMPLPKPPGIVSSSSSGEAASHE